jgi:hypothetical protein
MVDTSLVSDLLHHARYNRGELALVVGDDDDLLPGAFTAEAWGAQVRVLRIDRLENRHLQTDEMVLRGIAND